MAFLSVMGLYQVDQTIFDPMMVPEDLDKETVVGSILDECAELECVIPDPNVFKAVINYWSKKNVQPWSKMAAAQVAEYNPLWNKDGTYREVEKSNAASKTAGVNLTDRSAYDSNTYQPVDKSTANADTSANAEVIREREEHGNIGVTTTQQMIQEERDIADFDLYKIIIEEFKNRFCIMVY